MFNQQLVVQVPGDSAAVDDDPQPVPLARLDRFRNGLPFEPAAVDEFEEDQIVLQGVDPQHKIVADVPDPEGQTAGLIDLAGRRLDLQGNRAFLNEAVFGDRDGKMELGVDGVQGWIRCGPE
jgi:hypothetical protein